ncbi:MAG: glycoside hydrolase family 9 protein [Bacilli bacterium]|nr:glycoside hydrolase family 9 protein [Bacilli bacterium]
MLFKSEDSSYSAKLLSHAIEELYNFADKYRCDYTKGIPASGFYSSYSGDNDELDWRAMWLYI